MALRYRQLSSMSESIAQRVDVAVDMQQKANRVLTHVLGAQYTLCKHASQHHILTKQSLLAPHFNRIGGAGLMSSAILVHWA